MVLAPVDPSTTDAERTEWDVEPLAVLHGAVGPPREARPEPAPASP